MMRRRQPLAAAVVVALASVVSLHAAQERARPSAAGEGEHTAGKTATPPEATETSKRDKPAAQPSLASTVERIKKRLAEVAQESSSARPSTIAPRGGAAASRASVRLEWRESLVWPAELLTPPMEPTGVTPAIVLVWR